MPIQPALNYQPYSGHPLGSHAMGGRLLTRKATVNNQLAIILFIQSIEAELRQETQQERQRSQQQNREQQQQPQQHVIGMARADVQQHTVYHSSTGPFVGSGNTITAKALRASTIAEEVEQTVRRAMIKYAALRLFTGLIYWSSWISRELTGSERRRRERGTCGAGEICM